MLVCTVHVLRMYVHKVPRYLYAQVPGNNTVAISGSYAVQLHYRSRHTLLCICHARHLCERARMSHACRLMAHKVLTAKDNAA